MLTTFWALFCLTGIVTTKWLKASTITWMYEFWFDGGFIGFLCPLIFGIWNMKHFLKMFVAVWIFWLICLFCWHSIQPWLNIDIHLFKYGMKETWLKYIMVILISECPCAWSLLKAAWKSLNGKQFVFLIWVWIMNITIIYMDDFRIMVNVQLIEDLVVGRNYLLLLDLFVKVVR